MNYRVTHWGRVTHICVGNLTIIGSDNGLSPVRRQAITWTNVGILLIGPLGTNFSEMLIEIHTFWFKRIHLKISSGKCRPFCLGLNVINICLIDNPTKPIVPLSFTLLWGFQISIGIYTMYLRAFMSVHICAYWYACMPTFTCLDTYVHLYWGTRTMTLIDLDFVACKDPTSQTIKYRYYAFRKTYVYIFTAM